MTESRKEITAGKIRQTALELFSTEGYYNTSIRQIAQKADIALGLLYSHYTGKEALLRDLFQTGVKRIRDEFIYESAKKTLSEQILLAYNLLQRHHNYWRLLHSVRMQKSLSDYLFQEIEDVNLFFIEHFRSQLKALKIKNSRTEARIIWTCIDGMFGLQQIREDLPSDKILQVLASRYS